MYKKLLFFLSTTLFLFTGIAQAEPEDLIHYDLSLAGYRLGMTFDDAAAVRPFQLLQDKEDSANTLIIIAFIEHVYIDTIETNLWVQFRDGKAAKIIVQFAPDGIEEMLQHLQAALGPGRNKSRIVTNSNGAEIKQTICQWIFPYAKLHLVGISSNTEYATISLVKKKKDHRTAPEEK